MFPHLFPLYLKQLATKQRMNSDEATPKQDISENAAFSEISEDKKRWFWWRTWQSMLPITNEILGFGNFTGQ